MIKIETIQIANRICHIFRCGKEEKIVYLGIQKDKEKEVEKIVEKLYKLTKDMSFVLVIYEVENWNDDFSPWEALPVLKEVRFSGNAGDTLLWLLEAISMIEGKDTNSFLPERRFLAGYSLAGLFSLWAFYEEEQFGGVASCSGSLWFPKWKEYIDIHRPKSQGSIYLSLGKKEEKTRNAIMAQIGEITKLQYQYLERDERIKHCILKYHSGGHFHEVEDRIAQGIAWLIKNSEIDGVKSYVCKV